MSNGFTSIPLSWKRTCASASCNHGPASYTLAALGRSSDYCKACAQKIASIFDVKLPPPKETA